ncbi:MAG: YigZ family protein [Actinomycetaceae bacterium]|nr:YigZ family protein [Actinomycetaceae bacterium]
MSIYRLPADTELRAELEIKRSRFITMIRRVSTVDEARQLLADARDEFPDARHHCSAYVVSQPDAQPILNSSDDGEPSGTAGRPMLDILTGWELTDISAVVVRYFGGTLLGTGGLVRAYSDSVRHALSGERIVSPEQFAVQRLRLPHANAGKIEADLRALDYAIQDAQYVADGVLLDVAVADPESFAEVLAELSAGSVQAEPAGTIIHDRPAGRLPVFD